MIKEKRVLYVSELRTLCIHKEWFTKGSNELYNQLFQMCTKTPNFELQKHITNKHLYKMADLIKDNSDTIYDICDIMYELNRISVTFYYECIE